MSIVFKTGYFYDTLNCVPHCLVFLSIVWLNCLSFGATRQLINHEFTTWLLPQIACCYCHKQHVCCWDGFRANCSKWLHKEAKLHPEWMHFFFKKKGSKLLLDTIKKYFLEADLVVIKYYKQALFVSFLFTKTNWLFSYMSYACSATSL